MDKATINQIDTLLKNSGLFPKLGSPTETVSNFDFSNETILITGAAGSIGSELSKQLIKATYKKLILIDIAESPLFHLINELDIINNQNIHAVLLNITEKEALQNLFETFKPTIVLHAAAYKHVSLMETNPYEAVNVNIFGTQTLADLAIIHHVKKFLFISTDKAVNPISIMGMSKYMATQYIMSVAKTSKTCFISTRFGNILGSNGSAIPLFKDLIKIGKPVIITDKAVSRYFMNNNKACFLLLKLAHNNHEKSNLFTFNMGHPIKILDLVERLAFYYNKKAVTITFSKLRPGEKLFEDLYSDNETLHSTADKDILLVKTEQGYKCPKATLNKLSKITAFTPNNEVKAILHSYNSFN